MRENRQSTTFLQFIKSARNNLTLLHGSQLKYLVKVDITCNTKEKALVNPILDKTLTATQSIEFLYTTETNS